MCKFKDYEVERSKYLALKEKARLQIGVITAKLQIELSKPHNQACNGN